MKLLDVNVVLPAHRADHPDHAVARTWLDSLLVGGDNRDWWCDKALHIRLD